MARGPLLPIVKPVTDLQIRKSMKVGAIALSTALITRTTIPINNTFLRPYMSLSFPVVILPTGAGGFVSDILYQTDIQRPSRIIGWDIQFLLYCINRLAFKQVFKGILTRDANKPPRVIIPIA